MAWLQIINESGQEIFSHNKPETFPANHTIPHLVALSTSPYEKGNTVFVSSFEASGKTWNYIVGFPYAIGKTMLCYNGENVGRLSPLLRIAILLASAVVSVSAVAYCFWRTHHLSIIAKGTGDVSLYYRDTSTKERPEGSGLDLAIAKQIIVLHGGDIKVKSGAIGSVKKIAQKSSQALVKMRSADNGGIVNADLEMLHAHIFFIAPLGASHMAEPGHTNILGSVHIRASVIRAK